MSYQSIVDMAMSPSLRERVAACAAEQSVANPADWAAENMWRIATSPGWAADWDYAVDAASANVNPDTGKRLDVISDAKILSAVQAILTP